MAKRSPEEIEKLVTELWLKSFRGRKVERDQNYFLIGGDSFGAMDIVTDAAKVGLEFDLDAFYQYPTIADLVGYLVKSQG